jgi:hypothetical protein
MTTPTTTMMRVPVRTWQEKAILCSVIGGPLLGLHESQGIYLGNVAEQLYDETSTDQLIDAYLESRAPITVIEQLLATLRQITPAPDAALAVPAEFGLLERLDEEIQELAGLNVSEFLPHVKHADQRQVAEATVIAIDLRETVAANGEAGGA